MSHPFVPGGLPVVAVLGSNGGEGGAVDGLLSRQTEELERRIAELEGQLSQQILRVTAVLLIYCELSRCFGSNDSIKKRNG